MTPEAIAATLRYLNEMHANRYQGDEPWAQNAIDAITELSAEVELLRSVVRTVGGTLGVGDPSLGEPPAWYPSQPCDWLLLTAEQADAVRRALEDR